MFRWITAALIASAFVAPAVDAQERKRLGYGLLLNNDVIDGGRDRWRTGGLQSSRIWGPAWAGTAPGGFGQLLELRLGAEIITPEDLRDVSDSDRRYAGALSVGLHTHFQRGMTEYAMGGDLVFVGPQTGLDSFQDAVHDFLSMPRPSDAVRDAQIGNAVNPTAVVEVGHNFSLGADTTLRPFVEARAGNETLARVGLDLTFGDFGRGALLVRDNVTGQRYRAIETEWTGFTYVLGADIAHVLDSEFLPDNDPVSLDKTRERLRAGVHWRSETGLSTFFGVTYLGEEFEGQDGGQFVGSLRAKLRF
ncbi:MAG: lipid A-modifier LpxR family protein [Tateyamaria sp.]|uniref:lipid A-modifier LpxR family protein n=1 Tax=Tateyamaria sp. TaxID=1929288 RepID=UPI0032A06F31